MTIRRTFRRIPGRHGRYLPGLGDGPEIDVTSFGATPIKFVVEGPPPCDDFYLKTASWELLGSPDRIAVTVEAVTIDELEAMLS